MLHKDSAVRGKAPESPRSKVVNEAQGPFQQWCETILFSSHRSLVKNMLKVKKQMDRIKGKGLSITPS